MGSTGGERRGNIAGNFRMEVNQSLTGRGRDMTAPGSPTPRCSEPSASGPGRGWFQNETRGNLLATPAPARDPRGPRFLYLACPSWHPGLLHKGPDWHSGRERERAAGGRLQGTGCRRAPGGLAGEEGQPTVPTEAGLWKGRVAAHTRRGCRLPTRRVCSHTSRHLQA